MANPESTTTRTRNRKKQAAQIAEQVVKTLDENDDVHFDGTNEETTVDELAAVGEADIFCDTEREVIKAGDFPVYSIEKNGSHVATLKKSNMSWDYLRSNYGAGSYKIILRSARTGQIVKKQSKELADLSGGTEKNSGPQFTFAEPPSSGYEQPSKQPSFIETFLIKSDMDEKARVRQMEFDAKMEARQRELDAKMEAHQREIDARMKEAERSKESNSSDFIKLLFTTQQQASQQLQAVMTENNKAQMALMTTLMTKMSERPPDDGLKAHELAKMLGDAEKNGYSRWKDIAEMIDKKAASKADEIVANQGEGEESITKTLIKGFIPVITQAMQSGALLPAPKSPQELELAKRQQEYQRVQIENQRVAQLNAEQQRKNAIQARKAAATAAAASQPGPVVLPKPGVEVAPSPKEKLNGHFKEHIQTLVLPLIAEDYTGRVDSKISAERCLKVLAGQNISLKDVLDNFKLSDIIGLVDQEAKPWFEEFYAHMEGKTRNAPGSVAHNSGGQTP